MKNNRQSMILDIIAKEHIETQEQLLEQLRKRGVASTQATISRDIKQLHLVKEPTGHGTYKYAVSSSAIVPSPFYRIYTKGIPASISIRFKILYASELRIPIGSSQIAVPLAYPP